MRTVRLWASGLPELLDCSFRWASKQQRWRERRLDGSAHTGIAVHGATALFDHAKLAERPITSADAVDYFMEKFREPEGDVTWQEDFSERKAEAGGIAVVGRYCHDISPRVEYRAIEVKLEPLEVACNNDLTLVLSGRLDRVRVRRGAHGEIIGAGPVELKSGRALNSDGTVKMATHAVQLGTYELIAKMAHYTVGDKMNLPFEVVGLDTHQGKVATAIAPEAADILTGDGVHRGVLEHAADVIASGRFIGNPSSRLCSAKYCPVYPCFYVRGVAGPHTEISHGTDINAGTQGDSAHS